MKSGSRPKRKEPVMWSAHVAYAVGLFVTDGCLSNNGRHLDFTSKDMQQLNNFKKCFGLKTKITYKVSGYSGKKCSRLQFGDVILYKFFNDIGVTSAKTKTIGAVNVPDTYFFDFLRGHHDGDGSFYSYWDPRWRSSFMYYLIFISASKTHIDWIRSSLQKKLGVQGHVDLVGRGRSVYQLKFAKKEGLKVLRAMYKRKNAMCLSRKKLKIERALRIVGEHL